MTPNGAISGVAFPAWRVSRALNGRTLGIIGMGHTGHALAPIGKALGMRVLGYRRRDLPAPPGVDRMLSGDRGETIGPILAEADFIVLAINLSDATYHLIGAPEIARMKPGVIIVNMARGGVMDETALIAAAQIGPGRRRRPRCLRARTPPRRPPDLGCAERTGDAAFHPTIARPFRTLARHHRRKHPPLPVRRASPQSDHARGRLYALTHQDTNMLSFVARRVLFMIPTLVAISVVAFILIQLPPGDFVTSLAASASSAGNSVDPATLEQLRHDYGLDQPIWVQYWIWISKIVFHGDFGRSFDWKAPVSDLLWGRLGLTVLLSFTALVTTWIIAFPVGIYSAVRKYSIGDYVATFLSFVGLAIPNFVLALILMYISLRFFNMSVGGLFSPQFQDAPWSDGKAYDLAQHMIIPVIVLSGSGIASLVRIMRANLLDELYRPYVITARAKGLSEWWLTLKYPVRAALNPFVSTIGWALPELVSGGTVTAIVLNLPTTGPLLLRALISQDIYLAGSMIMMLSVLTVIGTLISDLLLAWLDPRIRYR